MHRRHRTGWLCVLMVLLLGSCSWTSHDQYFVHWGTTRHDVVIRERASFDLGLARGFFYDNNNHFRHEMGGFTCYANRSWRAASKCVLQLLHRQTSIAGIASGVWGRATSYNSSGRLDDFHGAIATVHGAANERYQVSPCLTLSITAWASFNWTTRSRSHADCRLGRHTWN